MRSPLQSDCLFPQLGPAATFQVDVFFLCDIVSLLNFFFHMDQTLKESFHFTNWRKPCTISYYTVVVAVVTILVSTVSVFPLHFQYRITHSILLWKNLAQTESCGDQCCLQWVILLDTIYITHQESGKWSWTFSTVQRNSYCSCVCAFCLQVAMLCTVHSKHSWAQHFLISICSIINSKLILQKWLKTPISISISPCLFSYILYVICRENLYKC